MAADTTIIQENIPLSSRTVPGIFHFTSSLSPHSGSIPDVQSVTLPPHHLDKPGDVPKCKGFALVTFSDTTTVNMLVDGWPWLPRRTAVPASTGESSTVIHDAVKFGFRVLPKARWDALKEEYLAYRQQLLDEIAGAGTADAPQRAQNSQTALVQDETNDVVMDDPTAAAKPDASVSLDPAAPFPPGCLVFVRNVHPETNKTTLKTLFSTHAFGGASDSEPTAALDYVDFNKGMTSVRAPSDAARCRSILTRVPHTSVTSGSLLRSTPAHLYLR